MINRQRMLLDDLDSEGFPIPYPREAAPLLALNLGRTADHQMVQALLADHKCVPCNPPGWQEIDGTPLPPITWVEEARQIVQAADLTMMANHDGITRLSDSHAPDAYFGWK